MGADPVWLLPFAKGFRPLFLLAAVLAAVLVPIWLAVYLGWLGFSFPIDATLWHGHEMLFGYTAAVISGFLLTAASNWTKRQTATGGFLAAIALAWLGGRAAFFVFPEAVTVAINAAFLPLVAFALARAIVVAKNRRNYGVLGIVALLWAAQLAVLLAPDVMTGRRALTVAVDVVILLISVIGGRIIPAFTRNATGAGASIRSVRILDIGALVSIGLLLILDAVGPDVPSVAVAVVAGAASAFAALRALRWGALKSGESLLWVLHVGYLFVPVGLMMRALAAHHWVPSSVATHALTAGAVGVLTLGMMVRVTLGHTGRPLRGGRIFGLAFGMVIAAALLRGAAAFHVPFATEVLIASGVAWSTAFVLFLAVLGAALLRPRADGKPG